VFCREKTNDVCWQLLKSKRQESQMPRGARLDTPGTLHHVMVRGIEQGSLVRDDSDSVEFLRRYLPGHGLEDAPEGVSGYGTCNQSGNVMELCSVWHDETDSANSASGEESLRQERSGCWRYPDEFAFRTSQRSFVVSDAVNDFQGFRLVLPVEAVYLPVPVQETFVNFQRNGS